MANQAISTTGDTLLTRRQACAALGVGATKYWSLISQGKLEVVKLGVRCTRVKRSSVDRLIARGAA